MLNKKIQNKYYHQRLKQIKDETDIITFPEIRVTDKQLESINIAFFGFDDSKDVKDYYIHKIHGNILMKNTALTVREDVPDFQYIFDLGVEYLLIKNNK